MMVVLGAPYLSAVEGCAAQYSVVRRGAFTQLTSGQGVIFDPQLPASARFRAKGGAPEKVVKSLKPRENVEI